MDHHADLSDLDGEVSIPPRSRFIVPVWIGSSENNEGIIEGNTHLLFDRGLSVARGIDRFRYGNAEALVTNFSEEYRHLNKGTTIALLDEVIDIQDAFTTFERPVDDSPN